MVVAVGVGVQVALEVEEDMVKAMALEQESGWVWEAEAVLGKVMVKDKAVHMGQAEELAVMVEEMTRAELLRVLDVAVVKVMVEITEWAWDLAWALDLGLVLVAIRVRETLTLMLKIAGRRSSYPPHQLHGRSIFKSFHLHTHLLLYVFK